MRQKIRGFFKMKFTRRRYFISFLLIVTLPLLLIIMYVQDNCIDRLEKGYVNILNGYVNDLRTELDFIFQQMQSSTNAIVFDKSIPKSLSPDLPTHVWELMVKLNESKLSNSLVDEIFVYSSLGRGYIYSSSSSYSIANFYAQYSPRSIESIA